MCDLNIMNRTCVFVEPFQRWSNLDLSIQNYWFYTTNNNEQSLELFSFNQLLGWNENADNTQHNIMILHLIDAEFYLHLGAMYSLFQ